MTYRVSEAHHLYSRYSGDATRGGVVIWRLAVPMRNLPTRRGVRTSDSYLDGGVAPVLDLAHVLKSNAEGVII